MRALRGMRADADGLPMAGTLPRHQAGHVDPETEGMSVAPPPVENMDPHRRPRSSAARGKTPFSRSRPASYPRHWHTDPELHGFIEPSRRMSFHEYSAAVRSTRAPRTSRPRSPTSGRC